MTESPRSSVADQAGSPGRSGADPSTGELIRALSEQTSTLIRSELQLAQAEMSGKVKKVGIGAGMLGGAGVVALYGVGAAIATIILALATLLDAWLAALIVTIVLFVVAGVVALVGKKQVSQGTPPVPQEAIEGVKEDMKTVKGERHS